MKKEDFNKKLRKYVKEHISPTDRDKTLIIQVYESIKDVLGESNCIQIGSYPRFTSIRPVHDLDVLYVLGDWDEDSHDPINELKALELRLEDEYTNPTEYKVEISEQTHSITILFRDGNQEVFSVDVVPAYKDGLNEFNLNKYQVPELIKEKHKNRLKFYENKKISGKSIEWIKSDPRSYIEIAKNINNTNEDFRRTVKFIKAWKDSCKLENKEFKLKSFHIEQVIVSYFDNNRNITIFDAIFRFFSDLKNIISEPQILDRADGTKYIDDYLLDNDFDPKLVLQARDQFMIKLENITESDELSILFKSPLFYKRYSLAEDYLFDSGIAILTEEDVVIQIEGCLGQKNGFPPYSYPISRDGGKVEVGNNIKFQISNCNLENPNCKWKVRNDNSSSETRGDITDNRTKYDPERVAYLGDHYVECYVIKNNICIGKIRQDVIVENRKGYIPRK